MNYFHVDVFTSMPLTGNGLTVVFPDRALDCAAMLSITQEFKQFETIFIYPEIEGRHPFRVFTVEEELEFAGHPAIGAAAVIHSLTGKAEGIQEIILQGKNRTIRLESEKNGTTYRVIMDQGLPDFISTLPPGEYPEILSALNITSDDIHPAYPAEVVSTGLPYLLLPLRHSLEKAAIIQKGFESMLMKWGAKFVYLFDPESLECRTWDNAGLVEDVATGSAAGPLCAYLVRNGFRSAGEKIRIRQGRLTGRPAVISAWQTADSGEIRIEGEVAFFGRGELSI